MFQELGKSGKKDIEILSKAKKEILSLRIGKRKKREEKNIE